MVNYMFNLFQHFTFDLIDDKDLQLLNENRNLVNIITALGATVFLVEAYIIYTKLIVAFLRYTLRQRRLAIASGKTGTPLKANRSLSSVYFFS